MTETHDQEVTVKWTSAIGRFISIFAHVELLAYELFELLPQDAITRSHANLLIRPMKSTMQHI